MQLVKSPGKYTKATYLDAAEQSQDSKPLLEIGIEELSASTIASYRRRYSQHHDHHPWNELPDGEFLRVIGAAAVAEDGKLHPTGAGLLMFGEDWRITEVFPHDFLDYRQQISPSERWQDRVTSTGGDWTGNVYDFHFRVYNLMKQALKLPFRIEGITRMDDTPAHRVLRDALANCLTNANYHERRGVVCLWEEDAIRISNPGDFRVDIDSALRGGESDPRNENMLKMLSYIDVGERAGSGLPKIMEGWSACGYPTPSYEESFGPDRTTLTLPLVAAGDSSSSDSSTVDESSGQMSESGVQTAGDREMTKSLLVTRIKISR